MPSYVGTTPGTTDTVSSAEANSANACGTNYYPVTPFAGWGGTQGNVVSDNGVYATCAASGGRTTFLIARNYGLAVPTNETVTGVTVRLIDPFLSTAVMSATVGQISLWNEGNSDNCATPPLKAIGTSKFPATALTTSAGVTLAYGGASDSWGAMLTPAIVNSANFGVAVSFDKTAVGDQVSIDHITIEVHTGSGGFRSRGRASPGRGR